MSIDIQEIVSGVLNFLEGLKDFLFSFGDIAQKFFDALP